MHGKAGKYQRMFTHKGTRKRGIFGKLKHAFRYFRKKYHL